MLEAQGMCHARKQQTMFASRHHETVTNFDDLEKPLLDGDTGYGRQRTLSGQEETDEVLDPDADEVAKNTQFGSVWRREVWLFVNHVSSDTGIRRYARSYEFMSVSLVIYLVLADIILSIPELAFLKESSVTSQIEFCIYAVFTSEYLLRLWSCVADKTCNELGPFWGRVHVATDMMNLVDFLVCTAYYITFLPGSNCLQGMGALRMIRLMRVGALLKMERKTNSLSCIARVLKLKRMELLSTVFMAAVLMVMSAAIMYYIEVDVQPEAFGSIPLALWWSVTALTTVGYGDVCPKTFAGKLAASLFEFFGVGIFALPAGILGEGFMEVMENQEADEEVQDLAEDLFACEEKKELRVVQLQKEIDEMQQLALDVQKGQQQILQLLEALSPELVAEFEKTQAADAQKTTPSALPHEARGLADHRAALGDKDLVMLQDKVEEKLRDLSRNLGRNGCGHLEAQSA